MRVDDMIIAVAYFSIPLQLVASLTYYPRLMQMPPRILFVVILFALFVWCCGFGHFLRAGGYHNKKVFEIVNWITAVISLLTAAVLLPMVPTAMRDLDEGLRRLEALDEDVAGQSRSGGSDRVALTKVGVASIQYHDEPPLKQEMAPEGDAQV